MLGQRTFTLEQIKFCGKNVCGNLYLRKFIFADRWKNRKNGKKLEPAKILCHTVTCYLGALRKLEKIILENAFEEKKKKPGLKFKEDKTG